MEVKESMMMKKIRDVFAIILAFATVLFVFAGCEQGTEDPYPYGEKNYIFANADRTDVKDTAGKLAFTRLDKLKSNFELGKDDALIISIEADGYSVTEDIVIKKTGDTVKISLTVDNTENKALPESERSVTTTEYDRVNVVFAMGIRTYALMSADGSEYILAKDETGNPYGNDSYLMSNSQKTVITNYAGASDYSRIIELKANFDAGKDDAIRIATESGDSIVFEDVIVKMVGDGMQIMCIVRKTADKNVYQQYQTVSVKVYSSIAVELVDGIRTYKLINDSGSEYIIARHIIYS